MSQQPRKRDRLLKFLPSRHRASQPSSSLAASASSTAESGARPTTPTSTSSTPSLAVPVLQPPTLPVSDASTSSPNLSNTIASSNPPSTGLTLTHTPTTSAQNGSHSSSGTPAVSVQHTPPAPTVLEKVTLDRVLKNLTEEQQQTIRDDLNQASSDIRDALTLALTAAEQKKQLCINRRWTLAVGSHAISSKGKVDKVITFLDKFKMVGSTVASADPIHAGLPWAGVCLILQVAVSEKQQMDVLMSGVALALSMKSILDVYLDFYQKQSTGLPAKNLETALVELYAVILRFLADAIRLTGKSQLIRFWKALTDDGELGKFASLCRDAELRVEMAANSCDRRLDEVSRSMSQTCKDTVDQVLDSITNLKHQADRIELNTNFAKLPTATTCAFDSIDEERLPKCLENTRVQLQEEIERWIQDPKGATFFWLQGVAGTGKSTVARTMANTLHSHGLLGASFFFKRTHAERGNADLFFSSLATQLAKVVPALGSEIAKVLEREMSIYKKGIVTQFNELLLGPLLKSAAASQKHHLGLFILIDALDECDDKSHRNGDTKQLLQCLSRLKDVQDLRLRVVVTSRLEFPVELGFASMATEEHRDFVLHEIPADHIEHDIRIFFQTKLKDVRLDLSIRRKRDVLGEGWPGDAVIQDLTKRAVPLFIFASTACMFIADSRFAPQTQLRKIVENHESMQLESTYLLVLKSLAPDSDMTSDTRTQVLNDFREILGLIIFSTEPPSVATIASLLDFRQDRVEAVLDNLHSVLDVSANPDRPIRPFHLSFIEFLARPKAEHDFMIDERQTHAMIAHKCLCLMMLPGNLKQDICGVRHPGTRRIDKEQRPFDPQFSPAFAYACKYWVHHLSQGEGALDDSHEVPTFLNECFLYWFEAMSWLGKATEVIYIVRELQSLNKTDSATALQEFLADAFLFAREFHYIADIAPLQLYASALVFAPKCSIVKSKFKHCTPKWLTRPLEAEMTWTDDMFTLEGHTSVIQALVFSPDDKYLATCSQDRTVRVWDMASMACSRCYLEAGLDPRAVAFSNDSNTLAVGYVSSDYGSIERAIEVITYDTVTGNIKQKMGPIKFHAFSWKSAMSLAVKEDDNVFLAVRGYKDLHVWRTTKDDPHVLRNFWNHATGIELEFSHRVTLSMSKVAPLLACLHIQDDSQRLSILDLASNSVIAIYENLELDGRIAYHNTDLVVRRTDSAERGYITFEMFDAHKGCLNRLASCESDSLEIFAMSNAKDRVAFSLYPDSVQVRRLFTRPHTEAGSFNHLQSLRELSVCADGSAIAVVREDSVEVLDAKGEISFCHVLTKDCQESYRKVAISSDGELLAVVFDQELRTWDLKSPTEPMLAFGGEFPALGLDLSFSNDKTRLALRLGESLEVWDIGQSQRLLFLKVDALAWLYKFSDDDERLWTSKGCIDVTNGSWVSTDDAPDSSLMTGVSFLGQLFPTDQRWIHFNNVDLLWLPMKFSMKIRVSSVGGGTVAFGMDDGTVRIMEVVDPMPVSKGTALDSRSRATK